MAIAHARKIAAEHLDIGHAVMAEGDRLRRLQMGEARHHRLGMLLGRVEKGLDQPGERCLGRPSLFA
jgi:hypothetical protein